MIIFKIGGYYMDDINNMEFNETTAEINALKQVINFTRDDFSAASYARMAGIEVSSINSLRKEWIKKLRDLEGHALSLEEAKEEAITETKELLAELLEMPMPFNGKQYTVSMEKQNLLSAQLGLWALNSQAGVPMELTWNATGEPCEPWEPENLLGLANAVALYVEPFVQKQRDAEVEIKKSKSKDKVNTVTEKYKNSLSAIAR